MVLTDQQIILFIIDELKKTGELHFRGDDLYKTFLAGKEIAIPIPLEETVPKKFIDLDYKYFKNELFKHLEKHDIQFILGENDNLDIFINRQISR